MNDFSYFFWWFRKKAVPLQRETSFSSTACHNKAIMAEGCKTYGSTSVEPSFCH